MNKTIVITGASSGFGWLTALELARGGSTVYAGMLDAKGQSKEQVASAERIAREENIDLRAVEMDVTSQTSVDAAARRILHVSGRLDVVIHNAGHMAYGPAEAFTPEQLAGLYNVNVLGTQRVNRSVLPVLRRQRRGLLVWVGSTSSRGGVPPYLGPYFAAKAGMDALAISYAGELARWGIETTIVVPGAFPSGTNHFLHADSPGDRARREEYESGPTSHLGEHILKGLERVVPADADASEVARAIASVVDLPFGTRPLRVHVDPAQDGAELVNGVADRVRAELLRGIGLADLLKPAPTHPESPAH